MWGATVSVFQDIVFSRALANRFRGVCDVWLTQELRETHVDSSVGVMILLAEAGKRWWDDRRLLRGFVLW